MASRASKYVAPHSAVARIMFAAAVSWSGSALAFSQIGSEDGSDTQKEGIVAVPLPPLPGASPEDRPASGTTPQQDAPVRNAPVGQVPGPGETSPPLDAPPIDGPNDDAAAGGETTDEGETDTLDEPVSQRPDAGSRPGGAIPAIPDPETTAPAPADASPEGRAPLSAPGASASPADSGEPDPAATSAEESEDAVSVPVSPPLPPAEIFYGEATLPAPVRDLRARLIEIARAGEIEALRPYIEIGEEPTIVTFGEAAEDPIEYLKSASGDGDGVEVLAILLEVLEAGHIRSEPATDNEIFVWPYFTGVPLDGLTTPQKVELFEIVTAGDYQEMLGFGAYNFYRAGISPDGKLQFFVAGD